MPRKTLDIDPELDALRARIEKRQTAQKLDLGEIVLQSGLHKLLDAAELRAALIRLCQETAAAKGGKAVSAMVGFPARGDDRPAVERERGRAADLLGQVAAE